MGKKWIPAMLAGSLALSGCATGYGNPIGGVLGSILGGGTGYSQDRLNDFERAAANECAREASRYGQVRIERVDQRSRDTVVVYGRIGTRDSRRDQFTCAFRSDGRIIDFRLS